MSPRPVRLLLDHILERIDRIERFVGELDRAAFLRDAKTCDSSFRD
jgi:uncharacterized protein with HEPN domain